MCKAGLKISMLIILQMMSLIAQAQKTDKVSLKNGDVVTGEIKSLKFAKLSFDMTGPGTIQIKWEEVIKIKSNKTYQVTMHNGEVHITSLDSFFLERPQINLNDIVEIVRIKKKFFNRLYGDVSLGFNYAKSNDNLQFNFNGSTTYRRPKIETTFKLNSVITNTSVDSFLSKKQSAAIDDYRRLKKSYYINTVLGWQQNTELGLDNRFLLSLAGGKIAVNNNRRRLLSGAGLNFTREQSSGDASYESNLEGLLVVQFKEFRYTTPNISIDARLALLPGLSNWGSVRMDFELNSKIEIFKDFNVGLNIYDDFDNQPPAGSSQNDFGINFTLGYQFGK
ncbi:DUF481 domain-containing protein [Flavihumibacter sp. R14]|nr:DUF481 domain-containing protein [Flavihumibacter soli]